MKIFRFFIIIFLVIVHCIPKEKPVRNTYRVAIVQFNAVPEKNERNVGEIERLSREAAAKDADIIMFHESSVTDYVSDMEKYSYGPG